MELSGKIAVITGAGSGIGEGTAHALAEAGMHVAVVDLNGDQAERVAGALRERGVRALALQCDVADRGAVDAVADAVYAEFGAVHVLHNNAGIYFPVLLEHTTDQQWQLTLEVNLNGVINGVQAFLPRLIAQGGTAHIVNTASMGGLTAGRNLGAYTTTKYAVVGLSEVLRTELAPRDIGVSVVCPASVATDIFKNSVALAGGEPPLDLDSPVVDNVDERYRAEATKYRQELRNLDPMEVGRIIRTGIERNEPYILTHPELKFAVEQRGEALLAAFDRAAADAAAAAGT